MAIGPMVPLTTAANPFAARVLAAHLGAEGIVWELRGNVDGPYPVGPIEILVAEDDLELARSVVSEQDTVDLGAEGEGETGARSARDLWILLGIVLLAAAMLLGRLIVMT